MSETYIHVSCDSAISHQCLYLREMNAYVCTNTQRWWLFKTALFFMPQTGNNLGTVRRNEILIQATTWMNLNNFMLSENQGLCAPWFHLYEIPKLAKLKWQWISGFLWLLWKRDQPQRCRRKPFRMRELLSLWVSVVVTHLPEIHQTIHLKWMNFI